MAKRGVEDLHETTPNHQRRTKRCVTRIDDDNKVVQGYICFKDGRSFICVKDGDSVMLGRTTWQCQIVQNAGNSKLILENVECKNNRDECKKECIANVNQEWTKRTEEAVALTKDLEDMAYRCGESDDPDAFGAELSRLSAARGHHYRRISVLEKLKEAEATVTTTKLTTTIALPAGVLVGIAQLSSSPVLWCPAGVDDINPKVTQRTEGQQVQEKISLVEIAAFEGTFVRQWGNNGTCDGKFKYPEGVAVNPRTGHVFVCDGGNHRVQVFSSNGVLLHKWGTEMQTPTGIALSGDEVYITDVQNNRVCVFGVDGILKRQWGTEGYEDGQFSSPTGIAVSSNKEVFVIDTRNHRVQVFGPRGDYRRQWGDEGIGEEELKYPSGIAVSDEEEVFVCDSANNRVIVFDKNGSFLREWGSVGNDYGEFDDPNFVALSGGKIVVSDSLNCRMQVFDLDGAYINEWGVKGHEQGTFAKPSGVAVGPNGELFVCDTGNNRVQVFQ